MKEAVIVSTARTPIGKAYRGGFNNLPAPTLGAAAVSEAVRRAGIDPAEVDDVVMGCALQQGSSGQNIARQVALRAGLPVTVSGMSLDRQCSSGLMAVATAAKQVMVDGQDVRTWRREGDTLIVSLHQPVMGPYTLLLTFEENKTCFIECSNYKLNEAYLFIGQFICLQFYLCICKRRSD